MLVKHQLVILNRGRKRAPNLCTADLVIAGLYSLFMRRARVVRSAITLTRHSRNLSMANCQIGLNGVPLTC